MKYVSILSPQKITLEGMMISYRNETPTFQSTFQWPL